MLKKSMDSSSCRSVADKLMWGQKIEVVNFTEIVKWNINQVWKKHSATTSLLEGYSLIIMADQLVNNVLSDNFENISSP